MGVYSCCCRTDQFKVKNLMPTILKAPVRVFISSPYTLGDTCDNVRRQHDAMAALMMMGHTPFAPLLSHYQQIIHPVSWEEWSKWDFEWLAQCQLVLRLPGHSKGADLECLRAKELLIPVIKTRAEVITHLIDDEQCQGYPLRVLSGLLAEVRLHGDVKP